jgi:hypothetical protein
MKESLAYCNIYQRILPKWRKFSGEVCGLTHLFCLEKSRNAGSHAKHRWTLQGKQAIAAVEIFVRACCRCDDAACKR